MDHDAALRDFAAAEVRSLAERKEQLEGMARRAVGDEEYHLRAPTTTRIVAEAQRVTQSKASVLTAWRVGSGFAHARPWATLSVLDREMMEGTEPGVYNLQVTGSKDRLLWALWAAVDVSRAAVGLLDQRRRRHR